MTWDLNYSNFAPQIPNSYLIILACGRQPVPIHMKICSQNGFDVPRQWQHWLAGPDIPNHSQSAHIPSVHQRTIIMRRQSIDPILMALQCRDTLFLLYRFSGQQKFTYVPEFDCLIMRRAKNMGSHGVPPDSIDSITMPVQIQTILHCSLRVVGP